MLKGKVISGLYAALLVNAQHMVIFFTEMQGRPPPGRSRRGGGATAPAAMTLQMDRLYALATAPLEPLMLVLLVQQSTATSVSGVEPSTIPKLLQTLWTAGGSATSPTTLPPQALH